MTGKADFRNSFSGGTAASLAGVMLAPAFAYRDGRVVSERSAKRLRSFDVGGGEQSTAVTIGSSEHFALPNVYPSLREVEAYLGWFGPLSRALQGMSLLGEIPGARAGADALARRFVKGSTGGPGPEARAKTRSLVVAEAYDSSDRMLERVQLDGPNGYTFTGDILAWGAQHAAEHGFEATGALGPVEAFGLRALEAGCAEAGLNERATAKTEAG